MLDAASTLAGQLIAAESELQGLRQIYTDNNARVRALNARVGELRKQLERLGGAQEIPHTNNQAVSASSAQASDQDSDKVGAPFPTIKDLPLLGAKYTDYYRRTKIQETVFELLTEQYELARVQEARETPSVKVLDPARVPDRKSFPPRLLFVLAGTFSFVAVTAIALLTVRTWTETDPADPRKLLALEVASSVHEHVSLRPQNGDSPEGWSRRIWSLLRGQRPPSDGPLVS